MVKWDLNYPDLQCLNFSLISNEPLDKFILLLLSVSVSVSVKSKVIFLSLAYTAKRTLALMAFHFLRLMEHLILKFTIPIINTKNINLLLT